MGREIDNTIYYQFAADPNWDYSTGKLPDGYEPEWKWEERFIPVTHIFNNETVGPHKYRREKVGKQAKRYGFPMLISATDIDKIELVETGSDETYTYYRLDTTWDSGVVSSSSDSVKIPKGKDGTDGQDGVSPELQVPAETWFNTVAELKANTVYADGERYGVFENTTVYIYDAGSVTGEQPDDNPGIGRYEIDYSFANQFATIPDVEALPMVQAAKGLTPYLLQYWWDLNARESEIKTKYEANANTNAFTDADVLKLAGIEAGAQVNLTDAEVKIAYENNVDTNAFTDTLLNKLNGIESGATADQTDIEIKIAYENNANTNAFTDAEKTKLVNALTSVSTDIVINDSLIVAGSNATEALDNLSTRLDNYPLWITIPGTSYTATPASTNTITTSIDFTTYIDGGDVLRATLADTSVVYLYAKDIAAGLFTSFGGLLTGDITLLEYEKGNNNAITEDELELPNDDFYLWGDNRPLTAKTNGGALTSAGMYGIDVFNYKPFKSSKGSLVYAWASVRDCSSSAGDPTVTVKFNGVDVVTTFTLSGVEVESGVIDQSLVSVGNNIMVDIPYPGASFDISDVVIHLLMFNDKDIV